jgi:glycosyltransferase involved in cell wall biosynthesis
MPVYNGEQYVASALESLLAQDFEDFELIISDNGSTDRTQEICRAFASRDPRIRYVREEENQGAAWNFNRVFELARGEYFRWACHDDACEPTHLSRCVELLDESPPSVALVYTRTILINEEDTPVWTSDENLNTRGMPPHRRLRHIAENLRYSNVLYGLARREVLERTSLLGPYESSDYVLLVQLGLLGEFAEIPAYLFRRRVHPGMSRQANKSADSVAAWFSAGRVRPSRLAHVRLMREYARAVSIAPMGTVERLRTTLGLWFWFRRGARPLAKELLAMVAPGYSAYR